MKKNFKKLLSFFLFFTISMQSSIVSFALSPTNVITEDKKLISSEIISPSLSDMKSSLETDSCVSNVTLNGNVLTIVQKNGVVSTIQESVHNSIHEYIITENNTTDVIYIDSSLDEIFLNETPVNIVTYESISTPDTILPAAADIYWKTTTPNIVAETAIASIGSSTLYTLMFSVMGGIGVTLSVVTTIISAYQLYDLSSTVVYAQRVIYRNSSYTEYKYVDTYYRSKNNVNYITTNTTNYYGS